MLRASTGASCVRRRRGAAVGFAPGVALARPFPWDQLGFRLGSPGGERNGACGWAPASAGELKAGCDGAVCRHHDISAVSKDDYFAAFRMIAGGAGTITQEQVSRRRTLLLLTSLLF
jgi:hypothetical protein